MIIPNTKGMDEIKSVSPIKWSLIKNLSDFIKTLGLKDKNLWAPLDNTISSDLAKVKTHYFSTWKLLAFNNLEGERRKREYIKKTNNLIKDFQEKEQSWKTIKSQDEIIYETGQVGQQDPKYLKTLVKEITEDLKINYPIIVVQRRKDEYLWGFYYNPKNWRRYEGDRHDGVKEYNTIIKFAIPLLTTEKRKESGIYIIGIPITNRKTITLNHESIVRRGNNNIDPYDGFYSIKLGGITNPIKIYGVYPKTGFVNWNISPFELK